MFNKISHQVTHFTLVGTVGFIIDGTILTGLSVLMGMNIYVSRLVSFSFACLITWLLNRKYTFNFGRDVTTSFSRVGEYSRYVTVQIGGALLNLGIFTWLITRYSALQSIPIIPLAVGAAFGLVFNFISTRLWIYKD